MRQGTPRTSSDTCVGTLMSLDEGPTRQLPPNHENDHHAHRQLAPGAAENRVQTRLFLLHAAGKMPRTNGLRHWDKPLSWQSQLLNGAAEDSYRTFGEQPPRRARAGREASSRSRTVGKTLE